MNAPGSVRKIFKKVLQLVYNFKVDIIAGDANSAACMYFRRQEHRDLYNSSVAVMLREMQREVNEGRPLKTRFALIFIIIIIPSISAQQMTLIVASWRSYHGENHQDPE